MLSISILSGVMDALGSFARYCRMITPEWHRDACESWTILQ